MKSSKKLQISSHLLFIYINNQDRKWLMSVLVFSRALIVPLTIIDVPPERGGEGRADYAIQTVVNNLNPKLIQKLM